MKKKQKLILCGISAAVILAVVLCIALISGRTKPPTDEPTESGTETSALVIETPQIEPGEITEPETKEPETEIPVERVDESGALTLDEPTAPVPTSPVSTEPAGKPAAPITEKTPTDDGNGGTGGGITIGGGQAEKYNCGTPGHHCDGPETHAYIVNLELDGCPYCGKHDCPSFYAVDQWGNTCYTPSKCPKYDIHKDPVYYCQDCGRPTGDGSNGTCVQFVNACYCPDCGEWVEGWTCHTHK